PTAGEVPRRPSAQGASKAQARQAPGQDHPARNRRPPEQSTVSEGQSSTGCPGASNTRAGCPGRDPRQHRPGGRHFTSDRRPDRQRTRHRHTAAATQRHQAGPAECRVKGGMAVSTFAVFGMTRAYALAVARKRTPTHRLERNEYGGSNRVELTSDEWEAAVQACADSIMGGARVAQL